MGPREEAQGWQADDTPEPRRSLMRNVALPPHTTEETPDALEVARVLWMVLLRCRRSSTSSFIACLQKLLRHSQGILVALEALRCDSEPCPL